MKNTNFWLLMSDEKDKICLLRECDFSKFSKFETKVWIYRINLGKAHRGTDVFLKHIYGHKIYVTFISNEFSIKVQIVTWGAETSQVELYFVSLHGPHVLIGIISFITDFYFNSIHLLTMCTEYFLTNFQHLSFLDILCIGNNVVVRLKI